MSLPDLVVENADLCPLAIVIATELRASREDLSRRWLERLSARMTLTPNRIFPTDELLDHIPLLIEGIADFVEHPSNLVLANEEVVRHAMALGALRVHQGFDEYELHKEYEIFGSILFAFLARIAETKDATFTASELVGCTQRVFQAIALIQQATTIEYIRRMRAKISEREERLRAFNRALTHEFRNRIGATLGAAQVLEVSSLANEEREELRDVILRNVSGMRELLENLLELSQLSSDAPRHRHVLLANAVAEALRLLREAARSQNVRVRVEGELPNVEVPAAAIELCLVNLVSNAIKYSDPRQSDRWVVIKARERSSAGSSELLLEVRDNGRGIPEEQRQRLFERFFRAHVDTVPEVMGTGLGLSIVKETIEAIGGRVWAEFTANGTVFVLALPWRRGEDHPSDSTAMLPE